MDSSNVASTSNELSSNQLPTFEELSYGQPSTLNEPLSSGELSSDQPPTSELLGIYLDTKLVGFEELIQKYSKEFKSHRHVTGTD